MWTTTWTTTLKQLKYLVIPLGVGAVLVGGIVWAVWHGPTTTTPAQTAERARGDWEHRSVQLGSGRVAWEQRQAPPESAPPPPPADAPPIVFGTMPVAPPPSPFPTDRRTRIEVFLEACQRAHRHAWDQQHPDDVIGRMSAVAQICQPWWQSTAAQLQAAVDALPDSWGRAPATPGGPGERPQPPTRAKGGRHDR